MWKNDIQSIAKSQYVRIHLRFILFVVSFYVKSFVAKYDMVFKWKQSKQKCLYGDCKKTVILSTPGAKDDTYHAYYNWVRLGMVYWV